MTTSTTEPFVSYAGNGSTTTFPITFGFLSTDDTEVKVELITDSTNNVVLQTDPTEYSISGTTVTMVTAPATGETLVLTLNVAESQATDYVANDAFPAETHEAALDKLTRLTKQIKATQDNNTIKLPTNILTSTTITDTDIGASKIFRINGAGTGIELATVSAITNGGDEWGDPVDASITLDADSTYDLAATGTRFANIYGDTLYGTVGTAAQASITSVGTLTALTVDNITLNGNAVTTSSGDLTITPSGVCDLSGTTSHVILPKGTTAQRSGTGAGEFRYNTTTSKVEYYTGSAWVALESAGATGSWANAIDASLTFDTDSTYDIGTTSVRCKDFYADNLYGVVAEAAQTSITSLGTLTAVTIDNITIDGNDISSGSGDITFTPTGIVDMTASTDHFLPPTGTTAQRSGTTAGQTRYNSTTSALEYYNGASWVSLTANTGGLTLIATASASSSATIDFDNNLDSTYEVYLITFSRIIGATDGANINCRVGTGATPTYQSGASDYSWVSGYFTTAASGTVDSADSEIQITGSSGMGNAAGEATGGMMYIHSPSDTGTHTYLHGNAAGERSDSALMGIYFGGRYEATTAVTSIRFLMSSGNITSGEFKLYGLDKST
jgi:hypothetical protein